MALAARVVGRIGVVVAEVAEKAQVVLMVRMAAGEIPVVGEAVTGQVVELMKGIRAADLAVKVRVAVAQTVGAAEALGWVRAGWKSLNLQVAAVAAPLKISPNYGKRYHK
jgi:hypothetical protein